LKKFVDLRGPVSKKILKTLSECTESYVERTEMLKMVGNKDYMEHMITNNNYNLLDILTHVFVTCKPSINTLLQVADRIKPRYYTIASSSEKNPDEIRIAISLTQAKIKIGNSTQTWLGAASGFFVLAKEKLEKG
jgi:sulfite reductase alpha subunit-like flavoprotein